MGATEERVETYRKDLQCLQELTDQLLGHMKGHDWSFRAEIAGRKGNFSPDKLRALVEDMLSRWAESVRAGTVTDPSTGESLAEPYLRARRELYGLYLYLTMRCTLCQGAYAQTGGGAAERTDFAFLLEQARRLSRGWCVMEGRDGTRWNEPYEGFDAYFGFHLYRALTDPEGRSLDSALTPVWRAPMQAMQRDASLTNDGNVKRISLQRPAPLPLPEEDPAEDDPPEEDGWEDADPDGYDPTEVDGWDVGVLLDDGAWSFDPDGQWEEADRASWLSSLAGRFDGAEAYTEACRRFAALYREAPPSVLRSFYEELEGIVDLYLAQRGIAPLTDTDKTLDVYQRIHDGPFQQARRYARGVRWDSL